MKKTFRQYAIDYIQNRHLCKGYVDYIVAQLNKLEQIESIVDAYVTDNPKEPMYDTEDYMNSIKEVLEQE